MFISRRFMFTPKTIRIAAIIAILLSLLGLVSSVLLLIKTGTIFLGILSWAMMVWASFIGYQLSSYKLNEEEFKRVGIRIYIIIAAFGVFLFAGLLTGLVVSVAILATLWGLKGNYDEWKS